jgi:hypothetical protein
MSPNNCPDVTIDELARLLARGIVRHFDQASRLSESAEILASPESPESREDCLEVSGPTVLSVLTGLRTRDSERTRT